MAKGTYEIKTIRRKNANRQKEELHAGIVQDDWLAFDENGQKIPIQTLIDKGLIEDIAFSTKNTGLGY